MAITLSRLCKNTEKIYDLKLIAGRGGLENTVRWVHMVEDMEVPDFLHGNELVFTTGIANHKQNWMLYFVKTLKKNNAAGVVINIGPYISEIPPQVIVYCEQNDFPIFSMPWETRVIDVTYEFCRHIINDEKAEQSLTEAFKNLILNPENKEGYLSTLEKAGYADSSSYMVVSLAFKENDSNITSRFLSENDTRIGRLLRVNSMPRAAFMWNKNLTLIFQNTLDEDIKIMSDKISNFISEIDGVSFNIGISDISEGFNKIRELYKQSQWAIMIAEMRKDTLCMHKDLGINKILLSIENRDILRKYYNDTLEKLINYDKEQGADLCHSLRKYCEYNGSVVELANDFGVHRNTINHKIRKIKEILGNDIDYEMIMNLMLCFNIHDIINYKKG
ncbi:MAG: PucR family transcriptional regulator ligand-binding domain-containing protein [Clostridia bacterium]